MKNLKKISAIFLTLALMLSCCFVSLTASAAETVVDDVLTQSTSTTLPTLSNPITASVTIEKYGSDVTQWTTNLSSLQDGLTDLDCYVQCANNFALDTDGDGTYDTLKAEGEYYVDFIYDLGSIHDITNIVTNGYPYEAKFRVRVFQIYVSNSESDLFNDDNMVYRFVNEAQAVQQIFTFSGDNAQRGRYVAVRVLDPLCDSTEMWRDVRFRELRVHGTPVSNDWIHEGSFATMPSEVPITAIGSMGSGTITYKDGYANLLAGKEVEVFSNFTNGDRIQNTYGWDSFKWIANNKHDTVDISYDKTAIGEIIFHLENTVTPEYFVWIGRNDLTQNTTGFEIYGANSYADIRNNATLLATYERTDNTADNKVIAYKFGSDAPTFKYFKVKLLPNSANTVPDNSWRLCEILLFGSEAEDGTTPNPFSYDSYYNNGNLVFPAIANPLTATSVEATVNKVIAKTVNNPSYLQDGLANQTNESGIAGTAFGYVDGDGNAVWQTNGEKTGEIIYDLGALYDVDNILVVHHNNSVYWRTRHYKLYASTSRDDLFDDKNEIFDYVNDENAQIQNFSLEDNAYQFVGLRIYDPCQTKADSDVTNSGIRLYEFRVYGTEAHVCVFDQEKAEADYLATEANCQAPATYYKSCACGEKGTETFASGEKDASKHTGTIVTVEGYPATCQNAGLTDGHKYNCCDAVVTAQEEIEINATAHTGEVVEATSAIEATCKTEGFTASTKYDCCGAVVAEVKNLGLNKDNHEGTVVDSADNKPATETEPGLEGKTVYSCCPEVVVNEGTVIPALGYKVIFADYNGEEVYSVNIQAGESAAEAAEIAEAKLSRYGYTFAGWDGDTSVITSASTFTATYQRNVTANNILSINGVPSEEKIAFDTKITLKAGEDVLWKVNGENYHIGADVVMYAFGDMSVEAHELDGSLDKSDAFVSLLGTVKDTANGKFIAFVHVYAGDGEVSEFGAQYWNVDNPASFKNVSYSSGADVMTTLYGIAAGKNRGVKAYAIVNGETIYSSASDTAAF